MSRVRDNQKWVNSARYDESMYQPKKMKRIHSENEDYHKCKKFSHWLFVEYDMSYKAFSRKSKTRKSVLRAEFEEDTGQSLEEIRNRHIRFTYDDNEDDEDDWS